MQTKTRNASPAVASANTTEVERRLRSALQRIAEESTVLRPEWEPLLDSKRVVATVLVIEDLVSFKIPPDRMVRRGGYNSVDEAITDMLTRLQHIAATREKGRVRK